MIYSSYSPKPHFTEEGTPYFCEPGVSLIAKTEFDINGLSPFLETYSSDLNFMDYLEDNWQSIDPATAVCKAAGQICYASFSPQRTHNKDAQKYFDNIKEQGHFSVLEHANYTFLLFGISRSLTHELVRHRHASYSQMSQRYVTGKVLRFVERPEFVADTALHKQFEARIDGFRSSYEELSRSLRDIGLEKRKAIQQAARALLPNEVEAPIVVTANARAWRHFLDMRGSEHAEVEIRRVALRIGSILKGASPELFSDYSECQYPDGINGIRQSNPE